MLNSTGYFQQFEITSSTQLPYNKFELIPVLMRTKKKKKKFFVRQKRTYNEWQLWKVNEIAWQWRTLKCVQEQITSSSIHARIATIIRIGLSHVSTIIFFIYFFFLVWTHSCAKILLRACAQIIFGEKC